MKKKIKFTLPKRIIALIRLAGDGSSIHESVRAARVLRDMLEKDKFQLTVEVEIPDGKPMTWNDVTRSTEPAWKSKPQEPFNDFYRKYYEETIINEWKKRGAPPFKEGAWARPKPGPSSNFTGELRELKCRTCQGMFKTKFVGAPEMYECNDCQWTEYQRKKGEATS